MFFLFFGWFSCDAQPVYKTEKVVETQAKVYVTKTGDCYHSSSCSYLHSSKIPMGKQEAIDSGYYACSRCGGKSNGSIEVSYKRKKEVDPTTRNVFGGIGCGLIVGLFIAMGIQIYQEEHR